MRTKICHFPGKCVGKYRVRLKRNANWVCVRTGVCACLRACVSCELTCAALDLGDPVLGLAQRGRHHLGRALLHVVVESLGVAPHPHGELLAVTVRSLLQHGQRALRLVHHPDDAMQHLQKQKWSLLFWLLCCSCKVINCLSNQEKKNRPWNFCRLRHFLSGSFVPELINEHCKLTLL